jgi:cysteine desulfurase
LQTESQRRVFFDHAATTPLDGRVLEAMLPFLRENHGNPSSLHWAGREARAAVDNARAQVAQLLNAQPEEIIFTGSGTEADNIALVGAALPLSHIIISAFEHPAILETAGFLESQGVAVTRLPVTPEGLVAPAALEEALRPETRLVSIMAANNVVGTLQPVGELAAVARRKGVWFHTDAVQAVGKVPLDMVRQPIDLLSLSAHKLYGPKGVGALYVRKGVKLNPILHGGGQEKGLRPATENVAGIVGLGAAAAIAQKEMSDEAARLVCLRDDFIETITAAIPNAYLIGHRHRRLPGHVCFGFAGQENDAIQLMLALDGEGLAVSTGSACSGKHSSAPSHVLQAMGFDALRARGLLRISFGRFNTQAEIEHFAAVLPRLAAGLRPLTSSRLSGARG